MQVESSHDLPFFANEKLGLFSPSSEEALDLASFLQVESKYAYDSKSSPAQHPTFGDDLSSSSDTESGASGIFMFGDEGSDLCKPTDLAANYYQQQHDLHYPSQIGQQVVDANSRPGSVRVPGTYPSSDLLGFSNQQHDPLFDDFRTVPSMSTTTTLPHSTSQAAPQNLTVSAAAAATSSRAPSGYQMNAAPMSHFSSSNNNRRGTATGLTHSLTMPSVPSTTVSSAAGSRSATTTYSNLPTSRSLAGGPSSDLRFPSAIRHPMRTSHHSLSSVTLSPPRTSGGSQILPLPLDMDEQSKVKLERKRLRNREAATRCRQRKIMRVETLTSQANQLKQENRALRAQADSLRQQLVRIEDEIRQHRDSGCKISC